VAAVLVHIDLDGARPHAASLIALAAGRAVASSWGATLYAAVVAHDPDRSHATGRPPDPVLKLPGDAKVVEAIRAALARGGADKIVVALTEAPILPLWSAVGAARQAVLDQLRPRLVVFGAEAPSAAELGPRTAARIGARLFLRARARITGGEGIELRDRDGSYLRAQDSGAAVVLVGAAPRLAPHGDDDIDVLVIAVPGGGDPRVELAGTAPAETAHRLGPVIAIGDDAAADPEIAKATRRLARALGAQIVGGPRAAATGVVDSGAVVERHAPLAPELCVAVGAPALDLAGAASLVRVGGGGGSTKHVDCALSGPIATRLDELARALEDR